MKNKFLYLISTSLKRKIASKSFKIANLLLLVLIIGVFNLDIIVESFGGDFDEKLEIIVVDNTNSSYEIFNSALKSTYDQLDEEEQFTIKNKLITEEELNKYVEENDNIGIFITTEDSNLDVKIISEEEINTIDYQIIIQSLNQVKTNYEMVKNNISPEQLTSIIEPIEVERVLLTDEKSVGEQMDTMMSTVFPILILPFFMLTIYLIQFVGAEINEEKSSRSMEIVLTNVTAKTHFFAKIISANTFIIVQAILLFAYTTVAYFLRTLVDDTSVISDTSSLFSSLFTTIKDTGILEMLYYVIPLTLALFVLSFVAFSLVAGILASVTVNLEDYQQIQMPITIILVIGYYLSIMAGLFDGSIFIRVLSYIPFISAMLSPALLLLGQTTIIDVIISIVVLIIFNYIVLSKGIKVYKMGVLNYSSGKLWTKLFKSMKEKA